MTVNMVAAISGDWRLYVTALFEGLGTGGVYALIAIGYNLVFTSTGVFNIAQGDLVSIGTFFVYLIITVLRVNALVGLLVALVGVGVVGFGQELLTVDPYLQRRGRDNGLAWLITTFGASVAIESGLQLIFGSEPEPVPPEFGNAVLHVFGAPIAMAYVVIFAVALIAAVGLDAWSRSTITGYAWRATAEDREAAQARGINVRRVGISAFVLAACLSGLAGGLMAPITEASYNAGALLSLQGFVAITIGGFGSQRGALLGGLILGVVEAEAVLLTNPGYSNAFALGALLLVLIIRPQGLFGQRSHRVVSAPLGRR